MELSEAQAFGVQCLCAITLLGGVPLFVVFSGALLGEVMHQAVVSFNAWLDGDDEGGGR